MSVGGGAGENDVDVRGGYVVCVGAGGAGETRRSVGRSVGTGHVRYTKTVSQLRLLRLDHDISVR